MEKTSQIRLPSQQGRKPISYPFKIRDQLSLTRGVAILKEILLRQRELASNYRYSFEIELSYCFGSVFSNVIRTSGMAISSAGIDKRDRRQKRGKIRKINGIIPRLN
ncbi:MAG TPA: hypothetical protein ENN58_00675 [bacterium]|nr:hypothetical protein [bacterium]